MKKILQCLVFAAALAMAPTLWAQSGCTDYTAVPYSTDFEGYSSGSVPPCWLQLVTGVNGSNTFPSVYAYSPNSRNGNNYFEFEASSSSSATELVALPLMQDIADLKLTMWVSMSSSYAGTLEVGVWEDDNSLFVPVDTLDIVTFAGTNNWKQNYRQYTTYFNNYTGTGERIAIRASRISGQYTIFVDDLEVSSATMPDVTLPATVATNINTNLVINATYGGSTSGLYYTWSSTMYDAGNATMSYVDGTMTINYSTVGTDVVTVIATNSYGADTATMTVRALDLSPVVDFPYTTGFESDQDANWQFVNSSTNAWYIDTMAANGGTYGMYISNDNGASNTYSMSTTSVSYAYRPMQLTDAGQYAYSFDWRAYGESNYDYIRVWLVPASFEFTADQLPDGSTSMYNYTTATPSGWIDLGGGKRNLQSTWQTKTGIAMVPAAGSYNLVFMWCNDASGGTNPPAAIDNITFAPLTCSAVTALVLDDAQPDELTFHWTPVGTESEWEVTVGDIPAVIVYDTFYTAMGLDTNTVYSVVVRAVCGYDDTSFATTASFRTSCGMLYPPFVEDFEDPGALECWHMQNVSYNTGYYNSASTAHNGSGLFRFYYSTNPPQYLISPQLYGTESTGVTVSFWYKKYSDSYSESFRVGYSTTGTDDTNFVWGNEITNASTTEYTEFSAVYPAGVKYVAIKYTANNHFYLYIDDFSVGLDNGCIRPNAAYVDSVAPYDAYLRWTSGGSATSSYDLLYSTTNNVENATIIYGISDTTYNLTGLLPQTTYYAWVRSSCGGDTSEYRVVPTFTTQLTCAQLASLTMGDVGYTGATIVWTYNNSVGYPSTEVSITLTDVTDSTFAPITVIATGNSYMFTGLEAGHGYTAVVRNICDVMGQSDTAAGNTITFMTTSCAEISEDGTTGNSYIPTYTYYNYSYSQAIYTHAQMPNIDTIHGISFNNTTAPASGNVRNWNVYMGHTGRNNFSSNTWIPVDSMMLVASNVSFDASNTGWKVISFDSAFVYDGSSNLVIAIDDNTGSYKSGPQWASLSASNQGMSVYGDGTNYDPVAPGSGTVRGSIPAVRFVAACDVPTCFAPMVVVDSIGEDAVSLHWAIAGIENSWLVGIKAAGAASFTYAGPLTDTFYTFTGLTSNTEYTIMVGSLCTDTLVTTTNVTTSCGVTPVPYFTGFEGLATGQMPNCWQQVQAGNSGSGTFPSAYVYSNSYNGSVYFEFESNTGQTEIAALPDMANVSSLMLTFFASVMNHNFVLEAGVMEGNTFVPVDTVSALVVGSGGNWHGSYHEYEVPFSNYTGTGTRIALRVTATGGYTLMIDDVSVAVNTGCPRPAYVAVDSVAGSDITLHWGATAAGTYEVGYNTVDDVNAAGLQTVVVTDTTTTITGLDAMTQYFFWVRAVCGTDSSNWRDGGSASTGCDTTSCNVTVQMTDNYGDGWNGGAVSVYQAGLLMGTATIASGSAGTATISVCSSAPVEFRLTRGSYPGEMGCTILDGGGAQLYSGTDMSSFSDGALLAISSAPCPSCIVPSGITVVPGTTSATVTWTAVNGETDWSIYLDGNYVGPVSGTPSYLLTGLTSGTSYTVGVAAICSSTDSSAVATAPLHTNCLAYALPYTQNFNALTGTTYSSAGDLPDCWNAYTDGTSAEYTPHVVGSGSYWYSPDNSNSLVMTSGSSTYGTTKIVVLPVFNVPVSSMQMSFWYRMESVAYGSLEVGYITSSDYANSFVSVSGVNANADGATDTVDFSGVPATATNIAFRWTHNASFYSVCVDNIEVVNLGDAPCMAPVVGNVTEDVESVSVSFSALGAVDVAIAQGNVSTAPATFVAATGSSHTFTGLQPSTLYTIFLRQHCTDSTVSDWTSVTATTLDLGCVPPTALTVQGTGYTSVTLGWTRGNEETAWQVRVFNTVFDSVYTVGTNPVVVSGLIPAVTYNACVRSLCGVNNDLPGAWGADTVVFTTDICPDVDGLVVSNITAHTADASWNATTGVSGYSVIWTMDDAEQGNATTINPAYHLDGLEADMPYRVLVKNICTEGAMSEHWVSADFVTASETDGIDAVGGAAFVLHPNPASSSVTLSLDGFDGEVEVQLVDINGRVMASHTTADVTFVIDVAPLAPGAYIVRVTGDNATAVRRLIVR